jgi:pimeloyl-ACP methyl ester carboxylesterase
MGEGQLSARALIAATAFAAGLAAQPIADRRAHAWIEDLRLDLALALRGEPQAMVDAIAEELAGEHRGNPALPLARAFARLRGVEPDARFTFRFALQCFATPEICDVGEVEAVHLTMHLPFALETPGALDFDAHILDAADREIWRGGIGEQTDLDDLLRFRTTTSAPLAEVPDGAYRVVVDVRIDGEPPRAADPRPTTRFYVSRGFPQRAAAMESALAALTRDADSGTQARAAGAYEPLRRLYHWTGEVPGRHGSLAVLAHVARVIDNLRDQRDAWHGLRGWVPAVVPTGADERAQIEVRLPREPAPRPILLFVPGAPAWSAQWARPAEPAATHPRWLRRLLEEVGFDAEHRFQLAVMESPGRYASSSGAVVAVVDWLRASFGDRAPVVLVGEREGAAAITLLLSGQPDLAAGAVLIGGGSIARETLERCALRRLLLVPCVGQPANANLLRIGALADGTGVRASAVRPQPWCLATALVLDDVAALATAVGAPRRPGEDK